MTIYSISLWKTKEMSYGLRFCFSDTVFLKKNHNLNLNSSKMIKNTF